MKKFILGALLLLSTLGFSQDTEFKFTKDGFTDFVVTKIDSVKTQSELYKKALDWVQVTYKNPKEVIKAQIENDYIRIEGFKSSMLCTKSLGMTWCNDVKYQIEITFKEGKYKFDVISAEEYTKPDKYNNYIGGWSSVIVNPKDLSNSFYNKKGEIRSLFKLYPYELETTFNGLNLSLRDFLLSKNVQSKSKEW